jgi:hypothetical protein
MQPISIHKLANAFIPKAIPVFALPALSRFIKKEGGLWVGGSVQLSADGVSFTPNGLNRAFHVGLEAIHIPIARIRSVRREFGWFTGIVVVSHQDGEFRFRCYGAKQVAAQFSEYLGKPDTGI